MTNKKASFVISIDLELAWGIWDRVNSNYLKNASNSERNIISELLKIFDEFDIPVTWATVAALLDKNNKMIKIGNERAWYAPDIIEKIISAKLNHLIASHSYAHPNFRETNVEIINEDFEQAEYFFKKNNIKTNTLVFPRNQIFHLPILKKFNYKFFRGVDKSWYKNVYRYNKFFGKIANISDKIFPIKTNSINIINHESDLIEIPSSILLISRNGLKFAVTNFNMLYKIKNGIDTAIKNNEIYHIWFHPSNFYFKSSKQFDLLKEILIYINKKREQNLIEIKLMNQF